MQLNKEAGLTDLARAASVGKESSGSKHGEQEAMVGIFCTCYQHFHRDQEERNCHFLEPSPPSHFPIVVPMLNNTLTQNFINSGLSQLPIPLDFFAVITEYSLPFEKQKECSSQYFSHGQS